MNESREDVLNAIRATFPGRDPAEFLALVEQYGSEKHHNEKHRVQVAIVELSEGRVEKLAYMLECALRDYRDVLAWKQASRLTNEEGERLAKAVHGIIDKWGKPP